MVVVSLLPAAEKGVGGEHHKEQVSGLPAEYSPPCEQVWVIEIFLKGQAVTLK